MGWDIIDETAWQRNKALSLTTCWSRDETQLMRLPGKDIKHFTHCLWLWHETWWDSYEGIVLSLTHCWLWVETLWDWHRTNVVLLTFCCNGILWALPAENNAAATHTLLDQLCVRWLQNKCAMNLPPVFHTVGCNEIAMVDKVHSHILIYTKTPLAAS